MLSIFTDLPQRLEWPAMALCLMPRYQSKGIYMQFLYKGFYELFQSEAEFATMEALAFHKDATKIVKAVGIGSSYLKGKFFKPEVPKA